MSSSTFDNSIPELTEVIVAEVIAEVAPPAVTDSSSRATRPATAAFSAGHKISDEIAHGPALADWTDEQWRRVESEIRERIALQILGRIDFVLEQRVRDSLADVLQTAVEGLANEIKQGLHATLKEVITRAVAQEITRLKAAKN